MFNQIDVVAVFGRRGSGKSYLAQKIQSLYPKRVTFDTLNEYTDGIQCTNFNDFANALQNLKAQNAQSFHLVYQFNIEGVNHDDEFNQAMRLCYYFGGLTVTIEEIQSFCSVHKMPHWLKNSLLTGRHQNMAIIVTTQRPGECHKTIMSQCSHIFTGQLHDRNDIKYVSNFIGTEANDLYLLDQREFLHFTHGSEIRKMSNDFQYL